MKISLLLTILLLVGCATMTDDIWDDDGALFVAEDGTELYLKSNEDGSIRILKIHKDYVLRVGFSDFSKDINLCKGDPELGCYVASITGYKNSLFTGSFRKLTTKCLRKKESDQDGETVLIVTSPEFVEHHSDTFIRKLKYDSTGKLLSIKEILANGDMYLTYKLQKDEFRLK